MSCPMKKSFNSHQDFITCMKNATTDRKGEHHFELYHRLFKLFIEADTEKDGMVSIEQFSGLVDKAADVPRAFGFAPADDEIYKSVEQKVAARKRMFNVMDFDSNGTISFDEWYTFAMDHITAKVSYLDPHPNMVADKYEDDEDAFFDYIRKAIVPLTEEHDELYWYLLEMFIENDKDSGCDGNVPKYSFYTMVVKLIDLPLQLGLKCPALDPPTLYKQFAARPALMSFDEWLTVAIECVYKKLIANA